MATINITSFIHWFHNANGRFKNFRIDEVILEIGFCPTYIMVQTKNCGSTPKPERFAATAYWEMKCSYVIEEQRYFVEYI